MQKLGLISTVLGQVLAEKLGFTYSHEHLIVKPNSEDPKYYDYTLEDVDKAVKEVNSFKSFGGSTIVEMTPINYGRDVLAYKKISSSTGVNIVCCTGFHKEEFLPEWIYDKSDEDVVNLLLKEINEGIEDTGVKPGVLKFGTSSGKVTEVEKRIIKLVAKVQKQTNLPINTHCDKGTMAIDQAELILSEGVNPDKVILGHVDSRNDIDYVLKLCGMGFNVSIDHVGRELQDCDSFRIKMIKSLIDHGYIEHIFIAGDMGKKTYFKSYGGNPGLEYILNSFRENLLKVINEEQFEEILIENPKRVFSL